jgi:hypothetical protein
MTPDFATVLPWNRIRKFPDSNEAWVKAEPAQSLDGGVQRRITRTPFCRKDPCGLSIITV